MVDGAVDLGAFGHEGVDDLGLLVDVGGRHGGVTGIDGGALVTTELEGGLLAQQIHVGFPQRIDGSHVLPVAVEGIGHHFVTGGQETGDDVLAKVVGGIGVFLVGDQSVPQHLPVEAVNAHGSVGGLGLGGLFLELVDGIVGVGVQNTETGSLRQGDASHGDGAGSLVLFMVGHHVGVVHLIDVVAGENHHIVGVEAIHKIDVLVNGVGGTLVPAGFLVVTLVGGQNLRAGMGLVQVPGLTVSDILIQLQRLILGQNTHSVDAGVDTVAQRKIDDTVFAAEGNGRLGGFLRQDLKPAALAAGKQHRNYALFLKIHGHSSLCRFFENLPLTRRFVSASLGFVQMFGDIYPL